MNDSQSVAWKPPVIYEVLSGGPWICFHHLGQVSITLHGPMSSANCSLITDFWVSLSFSSQLKRQIQTQNLGQLLQSFLRNFFLRDWMKGGFNLIHVWKCYLILEHQRQTGDVSTLHCFKIAELWGHQLSALHKVLNCEQILTPKIQNTSIFCMPFYTLPWCSQALFSTIWNDQN